MKKVFNLCLFLLASAQIAHAEPSANYKTPDEAAEKVRQDCDQIPGVHDVDSDQGISLPPQSRQVTLKACQEKGGDLCMSTDNLHNMDYDSEIDCIIDKKIDIGAIAGTYHEFRNQHGQY